MFPWFDFGMKAKVAVEAGVKAAKTIEAAVAAVAQSTADWEPKVKAVKVLTPGLRKKLADAFGHLAFNINAAQNGKTPQ